VDHSPQVTPRLIERPADCVVKRMHVIGQRADPRHRAARFVLDRPLGPAAQHRVNLDLELAQAPERAYPDVPPVAPVIATISRTRHRPRGRGAPRGRSASGPRPRTAQAATPRPDRERAARPGEPSTQRHDLTTSGVPRPLAVRPARGGRRAQPPAPMSGACRPSARYFGPRSASRGTSRQMERLRR